MNNKTIRKQYNAWLALPPLPGMVVSRRIIFGRRATERGWEIWLASRKALKVTIPLSCFHEGCTKEGYISHMAAMGIEVEQNEQS